MQQRTMWVTGIVLLLFAAGEPRSAVAQKAPELGYVFPPSVTAGSAEVMLGGFDFTPDMQFFIDHSPVTVTPQGPPGEFLIPPPPYWFGPKASTTATPIAREIPARLAIPEDTPEGLVRWQVANANGSSGMAVFYVSRGHEIVEQRSRDFPQRLERLPVAVSGRISRIAEVDRYEFVAARDEWVGVQLWARRLGADFHGLIAVRDEDGRLVADAAGTEGMDCEAYFSARANQTYRIHVHDADFRGDPAYVYRLALKLGPRVVCTLPAAGQRGTTCDVEILGFGFGPPTGEARLESVRQTVSFPADLAARSFSFPCAIAGTTVEVTIPLSNVTERTVDPSRTRGLEAAGNPKTAGDSSDTAGAAIPIDGSCAISRVISTSDSEHRYRWECQPQEWWSVEVSSRGIGGDLDPAIAIYGPDGQLVAENDDLPGRQDAAIDFQAVGGTYTCAVRDLSGSAARQVPVYRLQIDRRPAGFALTAPQQIAIPLGGRVEVPVQVVRHGGLASPIRLVVDGLPEGVRAEGDLLIPAGATELKIPLVCSPDALVSAAPIRLQGAAEAESPLLTQVALATAGGNLCPRSREEQTTSTILAAITMAPPFDVLLVDRNRQRDVNRGSTYPAEFQLVRKAGFAGEIHLQMAARQSRHCQGNRGPVITVAAGANTALYPCFMPEWLETDLTRRMTVLGVAAVADPRGNLRYLTKLADANVTMIMEGALLKLASERNDWTLAPGASFEIPLTIARSPNLAKEVKLELVVPEEVRGLLRADPLTIAPDQPTARLRIETAADSRLAGPWTLSVRATALAGGQWPVVSEAAISVVFDNRVL